MIIYKKKKINNKKRIFTNALRLLDFTVTASKWLTLTLIRYFLESVDLLILLTRLIHQNSSVVLWVKRSAG